MEKIKTRKIGHTVEYYLLAKEPKADGGESILYNGWYQIEKLGVIEQEGDSLVSLPECQVSSWTIRNRINNPELYDYNTLWELVTGPPLRRATRGAGYTKKEQKKKQKKIIYELPYLSADYLENMALFKPGSYAHTVI